jgi:hypothetical protein
MLQEPMIEKLMAMGLHGMAEALKTQQQDPAICEHSMASWRMSARRLKGGEATALITS